MISFKAVEFTRIEQETQGKAKYLVGGQHAGVEEAAVAHYRELGFDALWSENDYWWTLMALLFWDVIFARVAGAVMVVQDGVQTELSPSDRDFERYYEQFVTMNGMPADLFSEDFFGRRKGIIANRMRELENADLAAQIDQSYKAHYGRACRPVNDWDKFSRQELLEAPNRIGTRKILQIAERLLRDFNDNRAGLPDLIVFREGEFFFAEVKGERDRVSDKQRDWHEFIAQVVSIQVELLLVNHTNRQVDNAKKLYSGPSKQITVQFGRSSSKKRGQAIEFAKAQATYHTEGEGKDAVHGATFDVNDIERLFGILDLTSGWKSQKITYEGEQVSSGEVRGALWCFRKKSREKAGADWCKKLDYGRGNSKFGCSYFGFHEFDDDEWQKHGYVDTSSGEWVFDLSEIEKRVEERLSTMRFCPLLDSKKARRVVGRLPSRIDPKVDTKWAFRDNDYNKWFWHDDTWINTLGETSFPGMALMVGIQKIKKKEINEALRYQSDEWLSASEQPASKKKSGCFIATAAYGGEGNHSVAFLRSYRDSVLCQHFVGRLFVQCYYRISPALARWIGGRPLMRKLTRGMLSWVIKRIDRHTNTPWRIRR